MTNVILPHNIDISESGLADATVLTLTNTAGSVHFLNTVNNKGISIETQLIEGHIKKVISEAKINEELHLYKKYQGIAHIVYLYASRNTKLSSERLHWNIMYRKKQRKKIRRSLELIAYLKLAQELGIETGLDHKESRLLPNIGEEIDAIVLGLREELMIPSQEKIK